MRFKTLGFAVVVAGVIWLTMARDQSGFCPDRILKRVFWTNPSQELSKSEVASLLNQRFTYLGAGTQAAALLGEDGQTVLKVFLNRSLKSKKRLKIRTLPAVCLRQMRESEKAVEAKETLRRYATAFERLREETGLLYTRLDPRGEAGPFVRIICKEGKEQLVSLEGAPFLLQRYAESVGHYLNRCGAQEMGPTVAAVQELLQARALKGFYDRRRGFKIRENYGIREGRVVLIDGGQVEFSPEQLRDPSAELAYLEQRLTRWLEEGAHE